MTQKDRQTIVPNNNLKNFKDYIFERLSTLDIAENNAKQSLSDYQKANDEFAIIKKKGSQAEEITEKISEIKSLSDACLDAFNVRTQLRDHLWNYFRVHEESALAMLREIKSRESLLWEANYESN